MEKLRKIDLAAQYQCLRTEPGLPLGVDLIVATAQILVTLVSSKCCTPAVDAILMNTTYRQVHQTMTRYERGRCKSTRRAHLDHIQLAQHAFTHGASNSIHSGGSATPCICQTQGVSVHGIRRHHHRHNRQHRHHRHHLHHPQLLRHH